MKIPKLEVLLFKNTDNQELLPISEFIECITDLFSIKSIQELIELIKTAEQIEV